MNFKKTKVDIPKIEKKLRKLGKYSGCEEISYKIYYIDTEPIRLKIQTVTHQKEVYQHEIYISALMRMSDFNLRKFAENYLS